MRCSRFSRFRRTTWLSLLTCTAVKKASMGARRAAIAAMAVAKSSAAIAGVMVASARRAPRRARVPRRFGELHIGAEGIFDAILRLGLRQDVVRPLEALQQVRPVLGLEDRAAPGPLDQQRQVVIPRHGKAGVDDIMPDALVFEEDFEAVVEEGEEVSNLLLPSAFTSRIAALRPFKFGFDSRESACNFAAVGESLPNHHSHLAQ
jgi:hypothetical protein